MLFRSGTNTSLEILRDYRIIDIDDLLRRKEDSSTWMFPAFAEDIFRRRLLHAKLPGSPNHVLRSIMGTSPNPGKLASDYTGTTAADRALKIEIDWSDTWKSLLRTLYESNRLSAKLAEAWLRQRGTGKENRTLSPPPDDNPWEKPYWKKERTKQALFQLAARSAQRPTWSGADAIISLCMGGTLIFVSVCQHIWDAFLRSQVGLTDADRHNPLKKGMPHKVQALGIYTASAYWHQKISEQPGGGDRRRFIDYLGRLFSSALMDDRAMSYPGHNGFSVPNDELDPGNDVAQFLRDAVDYGDLHEAPHTTKHKDARQRTKWYLNPILSPYFRLPESHVKEPMYVDVVTVRKWLSDLKILTPSRSVVRHKGSGSADPRQLPLLPTGDETD